MSCWGLIQSHWKYKGVNSFSWFISPNVVLGCGLDILCKSTYYFLPFYLAEIPSDRNSTSHYGWDYNRDIRQLGTYLLLKCGNIFKEHKYLPSDITCFTWNTSEMWKIILKKLFQKEPHTYVKHWFNISSRNVNINLFIILTEIGFVSLHV